MRSEKEILAEIESFYALLFENKDHDLCYYSLSKMSYLIGSTTLTEQESNNLEGILTLDEICLALKSMKNKKYPGTDGFSAEFFKVVWRKLKYFVLRALICSFESGELSMSLKKCLITCLPKSDKARHFLKNWRPISLLFVVYKIAALSLALRLRPVLNKLISNTQSGFMTGSCIGENTRWMYDLMYYTYTCTHIPCLLMLIDFQKAFDSVSWTFLQATLKFFGFKESFCKWIKVLNSNVRAAVL